MNTMWSALLLICAIDSEGQFKENLQCTATVSQQVWRGQEFCMDAIAMAFNSQLKMPTRRSYSIKDFECFEWERQRHMTPNLDDTKL